MEVIFLGTGTSQGVPLIAHPNTGLDLNNPKNWRGRSCIHVVIDGLHVQVDAGPEFRLQCIREAIPAVDLFVLTHEHSDHILGMDDLRRYCDLRDGEAIPVRSTATGVERIKAIFPYAIRKSSKGTGYVSFAPRKMPQTLRLKSGSEIHSARLPHGKIKTLGLVFCEKSTGAKFAYFSDCKKVTSRALRLAKNADAAVLDGLRFREHPTHMSVGEAVEAAKKIGAKQTFITHTTHEVDYETHTPQLAKDGMQIAWDGLRLTLP
jgi:phosphoribosyl 1,2-cyclic phosphate phosphodiesterase